MSKPPKVTLEDVAARVGVSVAAVSQALSGKGRISQDTKDRIFEVVEELSYQPDRYAQNLAQRSRMKAQGKRRKKSGGKHIPPPHIMSFYRVPELAENLMLEIRQREEQGYDVAHLQQSIEAFSQLTKKQLYNLYREALTAEMRSDYSYSEPEKLPDILTQRPEGPREAKMVLTAERLKDRILGAWQGRIIGSVLSRPIQAGLSKKRVISFLNFSQSYPITDYLPQVFPYPEGYLLPAGAERCFRGKIQGAPFFNDLDSTLLTLVMLESVGLSFNLVDVATAWLEHTSYFHMHNTDRVAYRNLVWNISPEDVSTFVNPEAEFIGARMRADLYGYICPGKPAMAASLCYRDASLSHSHNGVYSAMAMAAMLAWAFVCDDPREIVETGISEIPANSRLAEALRLVLTLHQEIDDWEIAYEQLLLKYGAYMPIHAIPNMVWVALALLYGEGDFEKTLTVVISCGFDAGTNAASIGSFLGLLYGSQNIPSHWIQPLQDTVRNSLAQFDEISITAIGTRITHLAEQVLSGGTNHHIDNTNPH
jgi:ADP-ribosylglycohydrolase/transcriptional regulator with XRE-family HTH domain